jgi:hypothetical protein
VAPAPRLERRRLREAHHADVGAIQVVRGDVEGGAGSVGETDTHALEMARAADGRDGDREPGAARFHGQGGELQSRGTVP